MRVCDAAIEILKETDNPAVMWGDTGLLYKIAERSGIMLNHPEKHCSISPSGRSMR